MDQNNVPSFKPNMASFSRIFAAIIIINIVYKVTGNFILGMIIGILMIFRAKKKAGKTSATPIRQKRTETEVLGLTASETIPDAPANEDPLGEHRERLLQQRALRLLLAAIGIGVLLYVFTQNANLMKEIEGMLRNT